MQCHECGEALGAVHYRGGNRYLCAECAFGSCARCSTTLSETWWAEDGVEGRLCTACASEVVLNGARVEPSLTHRAALVAEAIDGLSLADADVVLEAVRLKRRLVPGPTTNEAARRLVEVLQWHE